MVQTIPGQGINGTCVVFPTLGQSIQAPKSVLHGQKFKTGYTFALCIYFGSYIGHGKCNKGSLITMTGVSQFESTHHCSEQRCQALVVLNLRKEKLHLFRYLNSEFSIYSSIVPPAQHILSINVHSSPDKFFHQI